jgi:hypothetical protein
MKEYACKLACVYVEFVDGLPFLYTKLFLMN